MQRLIVSLRFHPFRAALTVVVLLMGVLIGGQRLQASAQFAAAQIPGQQPAGTCSLIAQQALTALDANCTGLGRNSACYGYRDLSATFNREVPLDTFTRPADRVEVVTLQSITTAAMDETAGDWGVALLSVQANLPGTLPGQAVTFVLMGDTTLVNAVTPEEAALPTEPIPVTASAQSALRTAPDVRVNAVTVVPINASLAADAVSEDGAWVRVVYSAPASDVFGGWFPVSAIAGDVSGLPVVSAETRTPMQSFLFRTGLGTPRCEDAPSSLVVQGPNHTEVALSVNGADISIGSTVQLQSVDGAPSDIIEALGLPDEIADRLQDEDQGDDQGEQQCAIMQLSVINGAVGLNDNTYTLPEGNTGYSVYCAQEGQTVEDAFEPQATEAAQFSAPGLDENSEVTFSSDWGGFRELTDAEIEQLAPLEDIPDGVLNYPIELPDTLSTEATMTPTLRPSLTPTPMLSFTLTPTADAPIPTPTAVVGGAPVAITISNAAANGQITIVGQPFPVPFSISAVDGAAIASPNAAITFIAPASGASGTFAASGTRFETVYTNTDGVAVASTFTSNGIAGAYTVIAQAGVITAAKQESDTAKTGGTGLLQAGNAPLVTFSVSNAPATPTALTLASGNAQVSRVGETFPTALVARLADRFGNPVPGVAVVFAAPGTGASGLFAPGSASVTVTTNSSGLASAPAFTANGTRGTVGVEVSASGGLLNLFSLQNTSGLPNRIVLVASRDQRTRVNTAFPLPLRVRAVDEGGLPVAGATLNYLVSSGGSEDIPSAFLSATSATTDSSGYAQVMATANTRAGGYSVSVSSEYASDAFSLDNQADAPDSIQVTSGSSQIAVVNTTFESALQVAVIDPYGNRLPNYTVSFSTPNSGASALLSATSAVTSSYASITATANTVSGTYAVTVSSGALTPVSFTLTNRPGAVADIDSVSGLGQSTAVGTQFPEPLRVRARDAYGNLAAGAVITYSAPPMSSASASLSSPTVTLDASGEAEVTATANTVVGSYEVTASAGSGSDVFFLYNTPGPAAALQRISAASQQTTVGTAFSDLQVRLVDAYDNAISGAALSFTSPIYGASAQMGPFNSDIVVATTNSGGYVTVDLRANTGAGSYSVNVTGPNSTSTVFTLTNTPGAPTTMSLIYGGSQTPQVGSALPQDMVVRLQDTYGNNVPGVNVTYSAPVTGASATLDNGGAATTNSFGVAAISGTANTLTGGYTITASASGANNIGFSLTNTPGAASSVIVVSGDAQVADVNTTFAAPLVVRIEDTYGNVIPGANVTFTAIENAGASALVNGGGSAVVASDGSGNTSVSAAANGVAGTYTVEAAINGVTGVFTLTNNPPLGADLEVLSLSVSNANPLQGNTINYSISVRNNGPATITGAAMYFLRFNPPPGTNYVTHGADPTCTGYTGWEMNIYALAPGATCTLTISVQVTAGPGTVINETTAWSGTSTINDPDFSNNETAYPTVTVQ